MRKERGERRQKGWAPTHVSACNTSQSPPWSMANTLSFTYLLAVLWYNVNKKKPKAKRAVVGHPTSVRLVHRDRAGGLGASIAVSTDRPSSPGLTVWPLPKSTGGPPLHAFGSNEEHGMLLDTEMR